MTDEQFAVVAAEMQLPTVAVRFAALRRDARREPYTPADLIAELAAEMAAKRRRTAL